METALAKNENRLKKDIVEIRVKLVEKRLSSLGLMIASLF